MKKFLLILVVLGIMGGVSPGSAAFAQPGKLPHENPENATGLFDKVSLLLNYSRIIFLASIRQYEDAQAALDEFGKIDIPEEFRYIIERYNELCRQLFTTLDSLETILDETADMIARNEINEARRNLDNAEVQINNAGFLLDDLINAMDILFDRLGIFSSPDSSDVRVAQARLVASIEQLRQLLDMLTSLKASLGEQYTQMKGLLPTRLSLDINTTSVFIGESIEISGTLTSYDKPLAGKSISVILDDDAVSEITTGEDGTYSVNITIPYKYVESMTIATLYEPQGSDTKEYQASRSPQFEINTLFHITQLDITAPAVVYPGIPFYISGEIITEGDDILRTINIIMNDIQLTEIKASGQFNVDIALPEDIPVGIQKFSVIVEPREKYAGISQDREIPVSLMPIQVNIQTPGFIILPKLIELSGSIRYEHGPVANAEINLTLNDRSTTVLTSPDGSFTATLDMPLDISFIGQRDLMINIDPIEPWASSLLVKRQVMVINPAGSLLVLVAALALVIFISRRRWRVIKKGAPSEVIIRPPVIKVPGTATIKLTGIKGRIISAYRAVLALAERISGIRMVPHMTLREFLTSVTKLMPSITQPLTDLTAMAERVLYSNQRSSKQSAAAAEQLTESIKEELDRETS